MQVKNEQDGRQLALAAQAVAHAYEVLKSASHRLGSTTPCPENSKFLNRSTRLERLLLNFCKKLAHARDRADGY